MRRCCLLGRFGSTQDFDSLGGLHGVMIGEPLALRLRHAVKHAVWIPYAHHIPLLHAFECKRGDERSAHTRTVFSG